jgi:hypothetical protein
MFHQKKTKKPVHGCTQLLGSQFAQALEANNL